MLRLYRGGKVMAISKAEMWVQWTRDAVGRYIVPEEVEDADELADDMCEVAIKFADSMLDEYEERFNGSAPAPKRRRKTDREA
jgi:hypothetical protein